MEQNNQIPIIQNQVQVIDQRLLGLENILQNMQQQMQLQNQGLMQQMQLQTLKIKG